MSDTTRNRSPVRYRVAVGPVSYGVYMSAEAIEQPRPSDFRDASPREIRAALIPEEQVDFDVTWRAAMTKAAETMELTEVFETLQSWRHHAMITEELGHSGYRRWLAEAEQRARAGESPPGSVPWSQLKAELGL